MTEMELVSYFTPGLSVLPNGIHSSYSSLIYQALITDSME